MRRSKEFPSCFHRVSVKALVVKEGKILLVPDEDGWEMPGGGLKHGETITHCLRREVREEVGAKIKFIAPHPLYAWPWRYRNARGLEWYYSLVVAYPVELEDFNLNGSAKFFSKAELAKIKLFGQAEGLRQIFNPDDFPPVRG